MRFVRAGLPELVSVVLTIAGACCVSAFGQTASSTAPPAGDPRVIVPQLLGSNTLQDRAWGAFLAGRDGLSEYIPQLLGEL
ncbi:MAG TPA: hypothetical protein VEZ90_06295, partial [Blastocatellia bacterium]|nr:hypothetical protein [Blastocatellia bacterium]